MLRLALVMLCVACGSKSLSPAAARLVDGDDINLTDCQIVQRVKGTASDGPDAATHAKNVAREKAAAQRTSAGSCRAAPRSRATRIAAIVPSDSMPWRASVVYSAPTDDVIAR